MKAVMRSYRSSVCLTDISIAASDFIIISCQFCSADFINDSNSLSCCCFLIIVLILKLVFVSYEFHNFPHVKT